MTSATTSPAGDPAATRDHPETSPLSIHDMTVAYHRRPVLWDVDFLYGPKDNQGADTFVLCEINVSSVYPFPPDAMAPLVAETVARLRR